MPAYCTSRFAVAAVALLGAGVAHAAADAVPPALRACVNVKNNSERLACYDWTIEHLSSNSAGAAVPERSAEASFGASSVRGTEPVPKVERQELTSVSAHVTALSHDASGALVINLDNGQQWRQTSGSSSPLLEIGHQVTIARAALNSFRMSTPSGRVLKVKRIS